MRKFSVTLSTANDGPITFAVLGNSAMQDDRTGITRKTFADYDAAMTWVFEQILTVKAQMRGRFADGYDMNLFNNPWNWPNPTNETDNYADAIAGVPN